MADMPSKPTRHESLAPRRWHFLQPALAGVVLVAYVAGICLLLHPPCELFFWQKQLLGLGLAALASWFFLAATQRPKPPEILVQRFRLAQHSDFGKQLYTLPEFRERFVRLPGIGRVRLRSLGGLGIFLVLGAAWWLSPWPIRVKTVAPPEDMTVPLAEEIVAAVLVVPEPHMAVLQTPIVPRRARELAAMIADGAGTRLLALRELGSEHFEQARGRLDRARQVPGAVPDIDVLDAQLAMYDGRFADAARSYAQVVEQKPDDPLLRCQWAAALMQAGQFDQAKRQADYVARLCREGPPVSPGVHRVPASPGPGRAELRRRLRQGGGRRPRKPGTLEEARRRSRPRRRGYEQPRRPLPAPRRYPGRRRDSSTRHATSGPPRPARAIRTWLPSGTTSPCSAASSASKARPSRPSSGR